MKILRYALEALLLRTLFIIFRLMPVDAASNIGGWIGRTIGPKLATSRKAVRHLQTALPDIVKEDQSATITEMWDNLGRLIAEYPHLETIAKTRVRIEGAEHLKTLENADTPAIVIGSHLANWEVVAPALCMQNDIILDGTYRAPNNPWNDRLLKKTRALGGRLRAYPKSRAGGTAVYKAMKAGRNIGILIDQKYNQGIESQFFGQPAMTNPVFVQLAQKFDCPVIPVRVERITPENGAHFVVTFYPPTKTKTASGDKKNAVDIIDDAHALLERWIKGSPGQWLWLHRRWKSDPNGI